jgi:predicted RNA-binding Zn ribbon-like protein
MLPVNSVTMESTDVRALRLVGGDVAVDFVNTIDPDIPGGDHLATYADFRAWSERVGLAAGRGTLEEVRAVRARIDAVLRPLAAGDPPPPAALEALRRLELDALGRASLRPGGWQLDAGSALDRLVHAATELVLAGARDRLRACANCTWLFLDRSRNGSRRWCSMESCGTAVKVRRLTERRRMDR